MKYIKLYEDYRDIDPFGEENWDEVEESDFTEFLKNKYPDESDWVNIKILYCSDNQLTSLDGIEKLTNLEELYCDNNQLTSLDGIEKLTNLKDLWCNDNQLTNLNGIERLTNLDYLYCLNNNFSDEYKIYLRKLFKNKNLYL